ncbi:MAG: ABC transporter substrate-binding protein [Actinobacteria bacterium]|nr:ABC transporter substrate-binding protein [Actinomycetota bacterium]
MTYFLRMNPAPRVSKRPAVPRALAAVVGSGGQVGERDGAAGARLLRERPDLIEHAVAFLGTDLEETRFCWQVRTREWWLLSIYREREFVPNTERAVLTWTVDRLPAGLTARELDVLTLVAAGLTNPQIAEVLVTSPRTVATHVASLLGKLEVESRAGAAAIAVEEGLIRLPMPDHPTAAERPSRLAAEHIHAALSGRPRESRRGLPRRPSGRSRRPFVLGSAFPAAGPAGPDGQEMLNGSALAIDEINRSGGAGGRPVEQVVVDMDPLDPQSVRGAFEQLAEAEVDAITCGYVLTAETALELIAEYGAPFLHGQTEESYVSLVRQEPGRYGNVFQACPSETHYGLGFVRFLDSLVLDGNWRPHSRQMLIIETTASGAPIATQSTIATAERAGWEVAHITGVAANHADWAPVIKEIHRLDPAAVMIAAFVPEELAAFQRAFVADPVQALVYAIYAPSVPEFLAVAGDAADGLVWATASGTYRDTFGLRFAESYNRRFGRWPGRAHAGIAYDEVHVLTQAWSTVGDPRRFGEVAQRLRSTAHRGVNGSYYFGHEGQCGLSYPYEVPDPSLGQAHLVLQVSGRDHVVLSPTPYVERRFQPPPWW